jgi:hypothetical protein
VKGKIIILLIALTVFACKQDKKEEVINPEAINNANAIINASIKISGGELFESSKIGFDFRDRHYTALRNNDKYELTREFKDSIYTIKDILSNSDFQRFKDNELFKVADTMAVKYSASVNSVHYFSVLPYGLNNNAVNKNYLKEVNIKGETYHKIKVTFSEEGGGEDFEDIYVYWINTKTSKVDYLAYSYNESDGKGFRFREAYNERIIEGIRFVDYNNYKPNTNTTSVLDLDELFKSDSLKLLSKIELKNISVELINN